MIKLEPLDHGHNNNFDLLRLVAAIMVILSHAYLVTGRFDNEPLAKVVGFLDFGSLGVKVFFAISGYLITKSITRQTIGGFVWARTLRIFPGLILTALFCAFIVGPIAATLPLGQYFAAPAVYNFVWKLSLLHNFHNALPGTFTFNHYPNAVNSPIWTLPAELLMYLIVLLGGVVIYIVKKPRKDILITIITLLLVVGFFWGIAYSNTYLYYVFTWGRVFFLGGFCFLFRKKIVLSIPLL
jgi:peptidoglycan/LPS O-acetylase OafA/YrhL